MSNPKVTIAAATGYAGSSAGPVRPLVELAMHRAVADSMALGICDDTPHELLVEIVGLPLLQSLLGEEAAETAIGADYIRAMKLTARAEVHDAHRGIIKAHEHMRASELHNSRDD